MVRHFNYFLKTVQIIIIIIVKLGSRPCPGQLRCLTGHLISHFLILRISMVFCQAQFPFHKMNGQIF